MAVYRPLDERFWEKIDIRGPEDCWNWIASTRNGYGRINRGAGLGLASAHRLAWEFTYGEIPEEMKVLHRCDNPSCCNPNHLFLGTQADNVEDMMEKNRFVRSVGIHNGNCILDPNCVVDIRKRYDTGKYSYKSLSKLYPIGETQIGRIIRKESRTDLDI